MSGYKATSVQAAWDNHFEAFGKQDLDKIMLDYDEKSVATIYDFTNGTTSKFTGMAEIKEMFAALFKELSDLSGLTAPVVQVDSDPKSVFLCWACPTSGILTATDTFIFGDDFKVLKQNIVVTKEGYKAKSVQAAWDNHFEAFGSQNLDKIMLDYDDSSVAEVYDFTKKTTSSFTGLKEIREMFTVLFAELKDLSALAAPVVKVQDDPKMVFLCWACPSSGIATATDTFMFKDDFKISRQNIVLTRA